MATVKRNSGNQDYTNNADGFDISGGTTARKYTQSGGDITVVANGSAVVTFPSANTVIPVLIIKTSDEARTSNASLTADSLLQFTTIANTNYKIKVVVHMLTNATADSKYRMVHTGTTTRVRRTIIKTATGDTPAIAPTLAAFDAADVVLSTTGTMPSVYEEIVLQVGASGGTFSFSWAQNTSNGSPTTVLEGSYLEYAVT